jgi:HD-like signal output (HDOD) protein
MGRPYEHDSRNWQKVKEATERLPPFSPVLQRLLATLADEDVSLGELAVLIEKDAVLAGNVLRMVNSPLYGWRGTVNSVRHAVSLVGLAKLRNFALGYSISQMWAQLKLPRRWSSRNFNLHSVATAVLADLVALETSPPYAEGAFVAGLLHDIGKLVIAIALPADFDVIYGNGSADAPAAEIIEAEVLGFSHCEVSGSVLERWNLPAPIERAAANHHWPEKADSGHFHLAHVVAAVDEYLNHSGYTIVPGADIKQPPSVAGLEQLGVLAQLPHVLESCQTEFESLTSFF